jgi:F-type H+-transporting ATPase subunit b
MHFGWSTLALQTINFAILIWLLNRFLYKPVLRVMDARRAEIDKHYVAAQDAEAKAKEKLAAIDAERAAIAGERAAALKSAAAEAEQAAAVRHAQAEREAAALLDGARKAITAERDQAMSELRRTALDLAGEMARRLLREAPAPSGAQAWLDRIAQHLDALPKADRDGLIGQLGDGHALTVVTAEPLPSDAVDHWRQVLRGALCGRANIAFETDPELVAGAELHFPNAVVRFSWKSALAAVRAEIEARGDAR